VPASPPLSAVARVLVLTVAAVGFLFDTYELLMFPVIGSDAIAELLFHKAVPQLTPDEQVVVREWAGRMLWIAALCGGAFGLVGGWLTDKLGRKTIMVASILAYSLSPVAAAFSTELWQLVVFRCTTFIGVCVEMVAAVTWLAELFRDKRARELAIGWTLAAASLGGILVTEVYSLIVEHAKSLPAITPAEGFEPHAAWRYTLLTGLVPGAVILLLVAFVPESPVWKEKKKAGTLKRPSFLELFSPELRRTTIVTTILSACGYAAAFGALQLTPLQIAPGLPDLAEKSAEIARQEKEAKTPEEKKAVGEMKKAQGQAVKARRGDIQRWQELGGLTGRILLAVLLVFVPSRTLIRLFLVPGVVVFPLAYVFLVKSDYLFFATSIFFCGLLTVAQFSYLSEFLPKVFPLHLRGTGGSFATNVGGRMIGTMAATLNTEVLSKMFEGTPPMQVATAAAVIGGAVYLIGLVATFFLPTPKVAVEE
jgi:MFS family permease